MYLTALTLLAVTGCADKGAWLDRDDMACAADPYDWFGGLSVYLDSGEVGESAVTFNYAAPQGYISSVAGRFDINTGDYNYTVTYSNYFLQTDVVTGYGTVYHNGAVDLLETVERTDLAGAVTTWQAREERYGCDGFRQNYTDPKVGQPEFIDETAYTIVSADKVTWSRTDVDGGGLLSGQHWSDLTQTYTLDYGEGWYAAGTELPNGSRTDEFESILGDRRYTGTVEYSSTGDELQIYSAREVGSPAVLWRVQKDLNRVGVGSATFTYDDGSTCDVTYTIAGDCEYSCSAGGSGSGSGDSCDPESGPTIRSL